MQSGFVNIYMLMFGCVGDDAVGVRWADIDSNLKLYASHKDMIEKVARTHNAHW